MSTGNSASRRDSGSTPTGIRGATRTFAHFVAGGLLANTVPHAVKGLTGQSFPTAFSNPPGVGLSGPTTNIAWGAANLAIGSTLLRGGLRTRKQRIALLAGATVTSFGLASYFGSLDLDSDTARTDPAADAP